MYVLLINASANDVFIKEFTPILQEELYTLNNLLILGDFNYHVNKVDNPYAKSFLGLLESFELKQHIDIPTHIKGNTLDLVISRDDELRPTNLCTDTSVSPDHTTL